MNSRLRWIAAALVLLASGRMAAGEITVFAAASLSEALSTIGAARAQATGHVVHFNFAASNTLARQIAAGAPADLFISADEAQMDALAGGGLIDPATRRDLLGNTLVIVTLPDGPVIEKVADLTQAAVRHLSLGDPAAVPAGVYARRYLVKLGLWDGLEPKVVPAQNVRAALAVVESGNAEAGMVYKTDAVGSTKVKIAVEIPAAEGPPIIYPVAVVAGSRHAAAAKEFLAYLSGREARAVFSQNRFRILPVAAGN